ncbi:outer membrane beta-barrel protein [Gaoshiqia sp. Z1-71]|uniref:outer membrane beta-barrel protein n=1 Tax=Gaoshiqia hydrogeniformans TaxID=3290090 RepID=UPI003BF7D57E
MLLFSAKSHAQLAIVAGGNYATIRNNIPLENKKPITTYHYGLSVQYYPVKKLEKFSVINEIIFNQKGYQQDFEKNYLFRFSYLSLPVLINFAPLSFFSVQAGAELSKLMGTSVEQGKKTYNNFDAGLVFGFSCFDSRKLSFYSRMTYGIVPMLDYYSIDEIGNFTGEIRDLKNICLSVGIKFKLYNEKICLFK